MSLNPDLRSWLQYRTDSRQAVYTDIRIYREYTNGEHTARLNDDQIDQFPDGKDPEHVLNVSPIILNAKCDRLKVRSFELEDDALETQVMTWWERSGMGSGQNDLHFAASRDGDAYLLVDYEDGQPRLTVNLSYDGDTGVDVVYEDDDPRRPKYATKRWKILPHTQHSILRMNVYWPDRTEKYINRSGGGAYGDASWLPYEGDGDPVVTLTGDDGNTYPAAVSWRTDEVLAVTHDDGTTTTQLGPGGKPLGIPVFHFPNNAQGTAYGRSDLADVVPSLQDTLNDVSVSNRIISTFAGFGTVFIIGWKDAPSEYIKTPGGIIDIPEKDASVVQVSAENMDQMVAMKDSVYRDIATISGTPLPMINPTAQVAAEGTLQQQSVPLVARVEKAQEQWGNRYEDAVRMMLMYERLFGDTVALDMEQIKDLPIQAIWKTAQLRNEKQDELKAKSWREAGIAEELIQQHVLGIPVEIINQNKRIQEEAAKRQQVHVSSQVADIITQIQELEHAQNAAATASDSTQFPTGSPENQPDGNPVGLPLAI